MGFFVLSAQLGVVHILRAEALDWVLSVFIILFRGQKAQKKKSLNYAYCVSRLSTGAASAFISEPKPDFSSSAKVIVFEPSL